MKYFFADLFSASSSCKLQMLPSSHFKEVSFALNLKRDEQKKVFYFNGSFNNRIVV
jgi:hypothetical protein